MTKERLKYLAKKPVQMEKKKYKRERVIELSQKIQNSKTLNKREIER